MPCTETRRATDRQVTSSCSHINNMPVRYFRKWLCHPIIISMGVLLLVSTIPLYIIYQFKRDDDVLKNYLLNLDDRRTSLEHNNHLDTHLPSHHHGEETAERIPRIIHQTYINTQIPEKWVPAYNSCRKVHSDGSWTHILWTDDTARNFIEESYPWFLSTYDSYPYAIQRVDAIRYFAIYHFGGFYLDLDIGCRKTLEPFRKFDAIFPKTQPFGVSNDMMAASKGHVFFKQLITELKRHRYRVGTKYPTVMWSTGPVFVTQQLATFLRSQQKLRNATVPASSVVEGTVRVIPHELCGSAEHSFFRHNPGSSWHGWDVQVVSFLWQNVFMIATFAVVIMIFTCYQQRAALRNRTFTIGNKC